METSIEELYANELLGLNDWYDISRNYNLTEDIIREFKDKVKWLEISQYQNLSESFIGEFSNRIWWSYITYRYYNNFSEEFKIKFDYVLKHYRRYI